MNLNIFIKSVLRRPLRSLLLFLLIGLISFGFILKSAEYIVIDLQTKKAADFYRPVGTISSASDTGLIPDEAVQLVSGCDSLDYMDLRRSYGGVMENIYTSDYDGFSDGTEIMYMYADYTAGVISGGENYASFQNPEDYQLYTYWYQADFLVTDVVVGFPDNIQENQHMELYVYSNSREELEQIQSQFQEGHHYFVKAAIGDPLSHAKMILKPLEDGIYGYDVKDGEQAVLNDYIQRDILARTENTHTAYLITTKDMSMMPSMKNVYYLEEGRLLTREDDLYQNKVCVIRREMAEGRHLSVGDKISFTIRNSPYIFVSAEENWQERESINITLEIVGIFGTTQPESTTGLHSNIYIPDSLVPEAMSDSQKTYNSFFDFVLKTPGDDAAFIAQYENILKDMGCTVTFEDKGWESFSKAEKTMKTSSIVGIAAFAVLFIAVIVFSLFFFILFHKKEWIILNLLGTPGKKVSFRLMTVLAVITAAAVFTGGISAWLYTQGRIEDIVQGISIPGARAVSDLPLIYFFLLFLGCLILWLFMACAAVRKLGKTSLLESVRTQAAAKHRRNIHTAAKTDSAPAKPDISTAPTNIRPLTVSAPENSAAAVKTKCVLGPMAAKAKYSLRTSLFYVLKHIKRTLTAFLITAAVICSFVFCLGWLQQSVAENEKKISGLYDSIPVSGLLTAVNSSDYNQLLDNGFVPASIVQYFKNSGILSDFLLEASSIAKAAPYGGKHETLSRLQWQYINAWAIDRPEDFDVFINHEVNIDYAPGYDESIFKITEDSPDYEYAAAISTRLAQILGADNGDNIRVKFSGTAKVFKVIGLYELNNINFDVLMPMECMISFLGENGMNYATAEFTLKTSENRHLDQTRQTFDEIMEKAKDQMLIPLDYVIRDEELKQAIEPLEKNNTIIQVLYPIICIIFALVCAVINLLFVIRTSKEAAVLRILGTTKLRVGIMLAAERVLVCLISLILAATLTLLIISYDTGTVLQSVLQNSAICFISCIIASAAGALIVVRKKPLSLLQVKE